MRVIIPPIRPLLSLLSAAFLCGATTACIGFRASTPGRDVPTSVDDGAVHILDGYIAARIGSLEQRSPLFGNAMRALRTGASPVVIGTPQQVAQRLGTDWTAAGRWEGRAGDFLIMPSAASATGYVLVVRVDHPALRKSFATEVLRDIPLIRPRRRLQASFDAMVEAVLIHEIWGHLVPIAQAGPELGRCDDPLPGQPDAESCVMQREVLVRRELGLAPRTAYARLR